MEQKMFCYQCQETAGCKGCTACGVCGKQPEVAVMQDLLVYVTKGLSAVTTQLRAEGKTVDKTVNHLISVNLFITITNANFDLDSITAKVTETLAVKEELLGQGRIKNHSPKQLFGTVRTIPRKQRLSAYLQQRMRIYALCVS